MIKFHKTDKRKYKLGDILLLKAEGNEKEKQVLLRKIYEDKLGVSFLNEEGIALSSTPDKFVYDEQVKKRIKKEYPPNFKVWFLDFIEDIRSFILIDIPHYTCSFLKDIVRGIKWGWFMRNNYDWDWTFLLQMLDKKLKQMENYHKKKGMSAHRYSYVRQIALTRKYLHRVLDSTTETEWLDLFKKRYGDCDFYSEKTKTSIAGLSGNKMVKSEYSKCKKNIKKQKQAEKTHRILQVRVIPYFIEKEKKIFFKLMEKWIFYWWD